MRNLKWWQWVLIVFFGIPMIGATVDVMTNGTSSSSSNSDRYQPVNAEFRSISGDAIFAMTFDPKADQAAIPEIAREHCDDRDFCNVLGWTDPKFAARGFPLTERESAQLKFQYTVNRNSGLEQTLWDCRAWKQTSESQCLMFD